MQIELNGKPIKLSNGTCSVADLLCARGLESKPVAVEVNRELVPKRNHASRMLREGDRVEIVTLVGGG